MIRLIILCVVIIMNRTLNYMLIMFGTPEYDWMGFKITDDNPITFHHIRKYHDGGADTVDNGAILSLLSHRYLHQIELSSGEIYSSINNVLKRINQSRRNATEEDYKLIRKYMEQYEQEYDEDIRYRIKNLFINKKVVEKLGENVDLNNPCEFRYIMQNGINPVAPKKKFKRKR